ncbi:MAG: di-trans,poly-cis-decaprenylcistransferase [Acidobacteriia bacterium]|nr:di-trans,poly-cis-decaprenylcistransferase [Terriglobia bacterium]
MPVPSHRLHVALRPGGSRRWARRRELPAALGYGFALDVLRRLVPAAPACGIGTLTVLGCSARIWQQPSAETEFLFDLLREFLREEAPRWARRGIRVEVIGRRDRIPHGLRQSIAEAESATCQGGRLRFRLAVDYSAREALLRAACRLYTSLEISPDAFGRLLAASARAEPVPDVDLLIATGGQHRLDDFLLWESAHAELHFTPKLWPDFTLEDLRRAVAQHYGFCAPRTHALASAAAD